MSRASAGRAYRAPRRRILGGLLVGAACLWTVAAGIEAPSSGGDGVLRFRVNPQESRISAGVTEPLAAVRGSAVGSFRITTGAVAGDPGDVGRSGRVTLVIDAASYETNSDSRDRAVKADALEVEKFPQITFESTRVSDARKLDEGSAELQIVGRLTLHGVTREITVPVAAKLTGGRLIADGRYLLALADYGIPRLSLMGIMKIGDTATIEFHVVGDPA